MGQDNLIVSESFSLNFRQSNKKTKIEMQLSLPFVTTKHIPATITFLDEFAPTVLRTECFNQFNLPFSEEVKNTEIGHLFEHILLDQLCLSQINLGEKNAIFNGRTFWNWQKDPLGKFEIWIDIGKDKLNLFLDALKRTIQLLENLVQTVFTLNLSLNQIPRATII